MSNFHFTKIIAGVGPSLAKETVLSKVINMVDVFRINLSQGFDDNNKKYIDTILKLDNSKSVMLETKGADIRVKNLLNVGVKKGQTVSMDYSEYAQENDQKLFINYSQLDQLPEGLGIVFEQSDVELEIKEFNEDYVVCNVVKGGEILQYDRAVFKDYDLQHLFLTERDKKDIMRGLEHGVNLIGASSTNSKENIHEIKAFLSTQHAEKMKVLAKVETKDGIDNFDEILDVADGIILVVDKVDEYLAAKSMDVESLIDKCKAIGKPIIITYVKGLNTKNYALCDEKKVKELCGLSVDGLMLEVMIQEDDPLDIITKVSELLSKYELDINDGETSKFYEESDFIVRDYIIYNANRITKEVDVKAVVCYTENGYTTAKLSSLAPRVPVIAFTKSDETYRYLNTLWGVRGYKISQSFNYENLKRIGKEMIRIIFKGNISLDDKIIIVQANEMQRDEKTDMINGVELYKFKNI